MDPQYEETLTSKRETLIIMSRNEQKHKKMSKIDLKDNNH
ncbi:hypothetical protein LCGC14_0830530 [marine sediment metagenome]|uniref:Uncharacterized protein n=1 Tax=marine sediment metagenome TaxID=412755 RepID=A0A0F9SNC7_9ZZZZ